MLVRVRNVQLRAMEGYSNLELSEWMFSIMSQHGAKK